MHRSDDAYCTNYGAFKAKRRRFAYAERMSVYRLQYVDVFSGNVMRARDFEAATDEAAITYAEEAGGWLRWSFGTRIGRSSTGMLLPHRVMELQLTGIYRPRPAISSLTCANTASRSVIVAPLATNDFENGQNCSKDVAMFKLIALAGTALVVATPRACTKMHPQIRLPP